MARDKFENTLPDIIAEVNALDSKDTSVRRLQREIDKKKKMWYRFRVFFERELKADHPSPEVLAQLSMLEGNLESAIERVYKVVKKKMAKEGQIDLATIMQEQATFNLVFKAQRVVTEACLVASGAGDALERAKLGEAIEHLEGELTIAADSPLVDPAVKAMIPEWDELMQELRSLATGGAASPDLLQRLDTLQNQWEAAAGIPSLVTAHG